MPVILKIDSRRKVVYSTFYGEVGDEELLRHGLKIASDPDFRADFNEIVDFSDVTKLTISNETLGKMAHTPSLYSPSALHIIVASTEESLNLANRYKALTKKTRPNLFVVRTRAEAYDVLKKGQDW